MGKPRVLVAGLFAGASLLASLPASAGPRSGSCSVSPSVTAPGGTVTATVAGGGDLLSLRQYVGGDFFDSTTTEESTVTLTAPPSAGAVTVEVYTLTARSNHPGGGTVYRDKFLARCGYSVA